jgi:hypothetical protein
MRNFLKLSIVLATLVVAIPMAHAGGPDADKLSIRDMMLATFNKPDSRLIVEPIVVKGDHAVAGWEQSGSGGRALLRRIDGKWLIWLCSGDALKNPVALAEMGVPKSDAALLAQSVVAEEAKLPASKRETFSKFDGVVMVQGSADHDHAGGAPSHPHGH